jgi:hypothetical protein
VGGCEEVHPQHVRGPESEGMWREKQVAVMGGGEEGRWRLRQVEVKVKVGE